MRNPFTTRASSLSGPATDIIPVIPSDTADLSVVAIALYIESGGAVSIVTADGNARTVQVAGNSILPVGARRINATGTTAGGVHALVIA